MQQNNNGMIQGQVQGKNQPQKNILLPLPKEVEVNQFYKYTEMEVPVDTSERSGDIFKVGSFKDGNTWVDTFSLSKPLLMKLAVAAGVQFDPKNTGGEYLGKNCYKAKAFGAIMQADGTSKTHYDEKVINLGDEEDNFRLEFLNKSIEGITEQKQAKEAAKLFCGEWRPTENKWGKRVDAFFVGSSDREAYIDRGVLVNMILLRKTMAEKAMTGAQLRVIRSLLGVKSGYTKEELQKPFLIPRVTFSPDYQDPQVKSAMIDRGLNAGTAMFGNRTPAVIEHQVEQAEPLEEVQNMFSSIEEEAFASEHMDELGGIAGGEITHQGDLQEYGQGNVQENVQENVRRPEGNPTCYFCRKVVSQQDYEYSVNTFGKCVCRECHEEGKTNQ